MADYTRQISGSTTLMIRDLGGWVEFWVKTGSSTWNNDQQWSFYANGGESGIRKARMVAGGGWQQFGSVYVSYNQSVRFTIYASGLGFPTYDFWQDISRSTVPQTPYMWDTIAISSSYIRVQFSGGYDGGSPILEWQVGYGGNGSYPEGFWASNGYSEIGPFAPGQRVYFWARGRNAIGWSDWSNRTDTATWRTPDSPNPVGFSDVTQTSVRTSFIDRYDGGTAVVERQLGYGLDPNTPSSFAGDISGVNLLTNLDPGRTYYFWARNRNSVGWSSWSDRSQLNLIAGARVFDAGQWKRAVPYIKVAGVWRVARPWVRNAGVWKETSL